MYTHSLNLVYILSTAMKMRISVRTVFIPRISQNSKIYFMYPFRSLNPWDRLLKPLSCMHRRLAASSWKEPHPCSPAAGMIMTTGITNGGDERRAHTSPVILEPARLASRLSLDLTGIVCQLSKHEFVFISGLLNYTSSLDQWYSTFLLAYPQI
jgi:hypothetical protein